METKLSIFIVSSIVLSVMLQAPVFAEVIVHLDGYYNEFYFTFDKPRGTVPSYDESRDIIFKNLDTNNSVSVSSISLSISDIPGFTVTADTNSLSLSPSGRTKITPVFHASKDMEEGVHRGSLSLTGTNVNFNRSLRVQITWPDPSINAVWDESNWGQIKAGSNFTRNLIINESVGYKSVNDTQLILVEFGPANLTYTRNLGTISPQSKNTIPVDINIPTSGLVPTKYFVTPSISVTGTVSITVTDASYEIPVPQLALDADTLDFEEITFEPGKDSASQQIVLQETGGYTPIEGLNLSLASGEEGWIEYLEFDYISPGESVPVLFSLRLPSEASLGVKEWKYSLTTKYAGNRDITGSVNVYFPGVEDAMKDLDIIASTINPADPQKELLDNTKLLLENARGETELRDITMVMSVYSGARTLTNLLEDLKEVRETDLERAGAIIVLSNNALNRINIGNENLDKPQLKEYSEICSKIGGEIWQDNAESIVGLISEKAEANRESNYRVATLYYSRGAEIYSLLNDPKAEEYSTSRKQLEVLYRDSIAKAVNLQTEGDGDLEKSHSKMLKVVDFYFVINPFSYDSVDKTYSTALDKYNEALHLYQVAGENNDADLTSKAIEKIEREQSIYKNAFIIYGLFWIVLFIWFIIR
ncbi:MAG: hypothetical protein V3R57_05885, partial [Candidatus Bathyarchaeia archaeon]